MSTAAHRGLLCFSDQSGQQGDLHEPAPLVPRLPGPTTAARPCAVWSRATCTPTVPPHPSNSARWLNIPPRAAVALFDTLAGELERVELDGKPGWVTVGDTGTPQQPHQGIRLLPTSTRFVVAGQPRSGLYPGAAATRGLTPTAKPATTRYFSSTASSVGGGTCDAQGRQLAITVEPLRELTATHRQQLEDEVELVGAVMEAKPTLAVGTLSVGPHA